MILEHPVIYSDIFIDCGTVYYLENGKANFTGRSTKYNQKIPISCDVGYDIVGDPFMTCLANGSWSSESFCKIKGLFSQLQCTYLEYDF